MKRDRLPVDTQMHQLWEDEGMFEMDPKRLISQTDGRAVITFVPPLVQDSPDIVLINDLTLKDDLLLAPGDILVVH